MILLLGALAAPVPELYGGVGAGYQGGPVVAGGVGGDLGLRLHLGEVLAVHGSVATRLFLAPAVELDLGATVSAPWDRYRPTMGLELAALGGGRVTRFEAGDTTLPTGPLWSVRGIVRPLAFAQDHWTIAGPALSVGVGLRGGLALGVDLMQVGWRFE